MARTLARLCLMLALLGAAPAPPVTFTSYAHEFDVFEAETAGLTPQARVAAFRARFDWIAPGLYADTDPARLDRSIARALAQFPSIRERYRNVEARFPSALASAVHAFRAVFPDFVPTLPIVLAHELGERDGGSAYIGGRKTMLFGADVIARIHHDDSLQPFLAHELFHLEHARHFDDCDQFWCPLWQEGLATYAASVMTPGATDHQLLLDQPTPIRAAVDAHWGEALCRAAASFDSKDGAAIDAAFTGGNQAAGNLPARFGYYVGLWIAQQASRTRSLATLAQLSDEAARPIVAAALSELILTAHGPCTPPASSAPITRTAPRPA